MPQDRIREVCHSAAFACFAPSVVATFQRPIVGLEERDYETRERRGLPWKNGSSMDHSRVLRVFARVNLFSASFADLRRMDPFPGLRPMESEEAVYPSCVGFLRPRRVMLGSAPVLRKENGSSHSPKRLDVLVELPE